MKNFLIGMHGGFDNAKYKGDFRRDFFGIEACMFPSEKEVDKLFQKAEESGYNIGVHYPLIKKDTLYRDPFFLSLDINERQQAFESFEKETAYVAEKGAKYILTHFPKPVLINRNFDLQYWRFAGEKEWMYADLYPYTQLEENLEYMFNELSTISSKYDIQVVLENDAIATVLSEGNLLVNMFKQYDKIKVCLDIGRLHLQSKLDLYFNSFDFIEKMAHNIYLIHLWNTNPIQNISGGHFPVLPEQNTSEGWGDIKKFIEIIRKYNSDVKVLFEHRSDLISDEDLDRCYHWIDRLLGEISK